jgi:hypothetical protein
LEAGVMAIRFPDPLDLADEDCPTVQCGICDQWMCDCQARATSCKRHFDEPCMREGESE